MVDTRQGALLRARIMVIDDDSGSLNVIERLLRRAGYRELSCISDPLAAQATYNEFRPDVVLMDLHMPGIGGLALLASLRARMTTDLVPALMLTGDPSRESIMQALSSGAKDFVAKPFESAELILRVENLLESRFTQLALRDHNSILEQKVLDRTRELASAEIATLDLLARAAEFRDDDTGRHTQRVGKLASMLAATLGCTTAETELLRIAAPLHDIGKIGIPDRILLKRGPLTLPEREVMQRHPEIGADILGAAKFPVLQAAREIALGHHERWDGKGYPRGLREKETPLFPRIVAVADVFDALRHDRPYRPGLGLDEVVDRIAAEAGHHHDPEIVDAFQTIARSGVLENGSPLD